MTLRLEVFSEALVKVVADWFDDPETQQWLGNRTWPENTLHLMHNPSDETFRGRKVQGRVAYVAFAGDEAVGLITADLYDRFVEYGGEGKDGSIILSEILKPTAGMAFVIKPGARGKGYGAEMIKTFISHPELKNYQLFMAGAEPENTASIRCLMRAGFKQYSKKPDFEDMLYYLYDREQTA